MCLANGVGERATFLGAGSLGQVFAVRQQDNPTAPVRAVNSELRNLRDAFQRGAPLITPVSEHVQGTSTCIASAFLTTIALGTFKATKVKHCHMAFKTLAALHS